MTLDQVLALARKHLGGDMESSARLCLRDAVSLRDKGDFTHAYARAIDSLAYSVGVFNADYQRAIKGKA
jgi:hypothetical protein